MPRLGLISDTHGNLDPRALAAFADVDYIMHAGDICAVKVLWELEALGKPVYAVKGNCDTWEAPGVDLSDLVRVEIAGVRFVLVHERWYFQKYSSRDTDVVVFGHSHQPQVTEIDGILWVNPGSASQPRRSAIGRSVGILDISEKGAVDATIVPLNSL